MNEPFVFEKNDSFGAHLAFANCPKQSKAQLAGRLVDGMTADFGVRVISCAQLAILVLLLPFKALKKDSFSTFRVELIVRLYSNLCDKFNFDRVSRLVMPAEHALMNYRLGILTTFSSLRPQGSYMLSLADPEERLLARVLMQMQKVALNPELALKDGETEAAAAAAALAAANLAQGIVPEKEIKTGKEKEEKPPKLQGLWTEVAYQSAEDREARAIAVPGGEWEMPPEWECSAGFPSSGVLKFQYLAGPLLRTMAAVDKAAHATTGGRISVLDITEIPEVEIKEKK
jgi:hypothetical protein